MNLFVVARLSLYLLNNRQNSRQRLKRKRKEKLDSDPNISQNKCMCLTLMLRDLNMKYDFELNFKKRSFFERQTSTIDSNMFDRDKRELVSQ